MRRLLGALLVLPLGLTGLSWAAPPTKLERFQRLAAIEQELRSLRPQGSAASQQVQALRAERAAILESLRTPPGQLTRIHNGVQRSAPHRPSAPAGLLGAVPLPPAPCGLEYYGATSQDPVDIPDQGVVTTSLVISGATGSIWDVNLRTFLPHSFSTDLQVSLTSPAGTTVTLTTDNPLFTSFRGAIPAQNVFNGTVWDDQADPDGDAGVFPNDGVVTDHGYVNDTVATPLVPEEAFSAFRGENPNGTWTLTIADTFQGDVGTLEGWTLEIATLQGTLTTTATNFLVDADMEISSGPHVSTVAVSGLGSYLLDVEVITDLAHNFSADVDMVLRSPTGTFSTLTTGNAGVNIDVFLGTNWWDDANPGGVVPYLTNDGLATDHDYVSNTLASPLVPEEAFSAFLAEDPNGTWALRIVDTFPSEDDGFLSTWQLQLTTATCAPAGCTLGLICPGNQTAVAPPGALSVPVTYPAPTVTGDCPSPTVTCVPPSGSAFPIGTTTVTCTAQSGSVSATCTLDVTVTAQPAAAIPTLGRFGLGALGVGLAFLGLWLLRRRS